MRRLACAGGEGDAAEASSGARPAAADAARDSDTDERAAHNALPLRRRSVSETTGAGSGRARWGVMAEDVLTRCRMDGSECVTENRREEAPRIDCLSR